MKAIDIEKALKRRRNKIKAEILCRFFKTGKGEYGEGDIFWGINVPEQRKISQEFSNISLSEVKKLLQSSVHECRFTALLVLTYKYSKATETDRKKIFDFYVKNIKYVNNWDLVDVTCHKIVGAYLNDKDRSVLYRFVKSKNIWEKRTAIVSTYYFIQQNDFADTLKLAEILLGDTHDLIHKAIGWMLREVGKRDEKTLCDFLNIYTTKMPRTALRYAIERLPREFKEYYMAL